MSNIELRQLENDRCSSRERSSSYSEAIKNSWITDTGDNDTYTLTNKVFNDTNCGILLRSDADETLVENEKSLVDLEYENVFKDCDEYLTSDTEHDYENRKFIAIANTSESGCIASTSGNVPTVNSDQDDSTYIYNTNDTSTEYTQIFPVQRNIHHGRKNTGSRKLRSRRVVLKNGEENVPIRLNIKRKSIKYLRDLVNTVINSKWRFLLCFFVLSHFVFWILFALVWFTVATSYRDEYQDGKEHCVTGASSFAGMLLLSIETQMTIGYGSRYPNEECLEAILIMVFEIIVGTALSGGLSGILFSKMVRPQKHIKDVGFSNKAAICLRDNYLCLLFRVWDLNNLHTINSCITAYLLKPIRTLEGEHYNNFIYELKLTDNKSFLIWPLTVSHVIDETSPLYDISPKELMETKFEVVLCLTGGSRSMGTVSQSRTSYLPKEIMWGHRFVNVVRYDKQSHAYVIDLNNLHKLEQVDTPLCSAAHLKLYQEGLISPTNTSQ